MVDRIDPDKHAIGAKQLLAYLVREVFVINGRLGMDTDIGELFEDAIEAVVLRRRGSSGFEIATPKNCDFPPRPCGIACGARKERPRRANFPRTRSIVSALLPTLS